VTESVLRLHTAGEDPTLTAALLDPGDDAALTHALLHRHDPGGGVVVVHPTPGIWASAAFGHDLLAALGHAVNRLGEERLASRTRSWQAAQAWMVADATDDLVVLRADRLTATTWAQILDLQAATGTRLLLVSHTPLIPTGLGDTLASTTHRVLPHLPPALRAVPDPPAERGEPPPEPVEELPALPARGVAHYRAEAYRRCDPAAFDRLDAVYQAGFTRADAWLGGPVALPGTESEQASLFLIDLVQDSPTRAHTVARIRGAQAAFLAHGQLLTVPDTTALLHRLGGPGLNTSPFTEATAARIRAGVAGPLVAAYLAAVLATGLSPAALLPATVIGGPENPHTLRVPWRAPRDPRARAGPARPAVALFPVPPPARPLLRAAALFTAAAGSPSARLLCPRASTTPHRIVAAAAACGITLPADAGGVADCWSAWVTCRRLHAPPVLPPGAGERWMATWGPPRNWDWAGEVWAELQVPADHGRGEFGRAPLTPAAATALLNLIHHHRHGPRPGYSGADWLLLRRQLAHYPPERASPGPAGPPTLTPHPDVLFALDLADEPDLRPERAVYSDHNDR
jgi:hypothetical protein